MQIVAKQVFATRKSKVLGVGCMRLLRARTPPKSTLPVGDQIWTSRDTSRLKSPGWTFRLTSRLSASTFRLLICSGWESRLAQPEGIPAGTPFRLDLPAGTRKCSILRATFRLTCRLALF